MPEDEALRKLNHIHLLTYLTAAPATTPLSLSSVGSDDFFFHLSLNELTKRDIFIRVCALIIPHCALSLTSSLIQKKLFLLQQKERKILRNWPINWTAPRRPFEFLRKNWYPWDLECEFNGELWKAQWISHIFRTDRTFQHMNLP